MRCSPGKEDILNFIIYLCPTVSHMEFTHFESRTSEENHKDTGAKSGKTVP